MSPPCLCNSAPLRSKTTHAALTKAGKVCCLAQIPKGAQATPQNGPTGTQMPTIRAAQSPHRAAHFMSTHSTVPRPCDHLWLCKSKWLPAPRTAILDRPLHHLQATIETCRRHCRGIPWAPSRPEPLQRLKAMRGYLPGGTRTRFSAPWALIGVQEAHQASIGHLIAHRIFV